MDDAPTKRPRFTPGRLTLLALLGIVLTIIGAWSFRLSIAEALTVTVLQRAGLGPAVLNFERLNLSGAVVSGVEIGPQQADRVEIDFTLSDLPDGVIARVQAKGVRLRGTAGPDGFTLDGLPAQGGGGDFPIRILVVEALRLDVETPAGVLMVTGAATIETPDGKTSDLNADLALEADIAGYHGAVRGEIEATRFGGGETFGRMALRGGAATGGGLHATGLQGAVQFIALTGGVPEIDATFDIATLAAAGKSLQDGRLTIDVGPAPDTWLRVTADLTAGDERIAITGVAHAEPEGNYQFDSAFDVAVKRGAYRGKARGTVTARTALQGGLAATLAIDTGEFSHDGKRLFDLFGYGGPVRV